MRPRAHLLRYAPWIALDYAVPAASATFVILSLFGWMFKHELELMALRPTRPGGPRVPVVLTATQLAGALTPALYALVFLGTMLAVHGMVSENRRLGYYRFLFAKPVNPVAYYTMAFATTGVAYLFVSIALLGLWALVATPIWSMAFVPVLALMYITFGGIAFLFSAAAGADGVLMVVFTLVSYALWDQWGPLTGIRHLVPYLLVPVPRTLPFIHLALGATEESISWSDAAWLGGYGVACFLLGLAVIRYRALGDK